eukprot:TRINITY_DN14440_c0_g1_i1.p1 TRINITY_DN14440_c0_g1~~TRINITY_DN14440_c0_g1_i1.p1  ORF type:complete len:349 (+),score=57.63 TRINITY_DN14440_c0_g1_i1:47-1048(+)
MSTSPPRESIRKALSTTTITDLDMTTVLGTGTFGRVKLTFDRKTQKYYACKIMNKEQLVKLKQVEHISSERSILSELEFPFIVNLMKTFQDERCIYLLFEYVQGGEFFSHLRKRGRLSNEQAQFYGAQIVLVFNHLHSHSIIYRDLKPENILLDREGHVKLADFGFAKRVQYDRTYTLCGTPEYLAPEIIQQKGHGKAVDWWTLGILIFEMLAGYPPFYDESNNPLKVYEKILAGKIEFPRHIDAYAKDLIKRLLQSDRTRRLGNLSSGARDVMDHKWFASISWTKMEQRQLKPPILPRVRGDADTSNFDKFPEEAKPTKPPANTYYDLFKDF